MRYFCDVQNDPRHASMLKNKVELRNFESESTYVDTKIPDEVLLFIGIGRSEGARPWRDVR